MMWKYVMCVLGQPFSDWTDYDVRPAAQLPVWLWGSEGIAVWLSCHYRSHSDACDSPRQTLTDLWG